MLCYRITGCLGYKHKLYSIYFFILYYIILYYIYLCIAQIGPEAHPDSYRMGTASFLEVNRPGRGVDHPPPSSAEVKERVDLNLYSPSGPSWPVLG